MLVRVSRFGWRAVEQRDSEALYRLHRATMRGYVEDVYGPWEDDVQRRFHDTWMTRQRAHVIEMDGRLVGVVDVEWRDGPADLYLARIEISPDSQNRGLGTAVIDRLAELAASRDRALTLDVIDINPARGLYERLGFRSARVTGRKINMSRVIRHPD